MRINRQQRAHGRALLIPALFMLALLAPTAAVGEGERTWTQPRLVAQSEDDWCNMALDCDSESNTHLVCSDQDRVYYLKLSTTGLWLVLPVSVAGQGENCRYPSLALDSQDNVHVVWSDERSGQTEVYYSKLSFEGELLVKAKLVSDEVETRSYHPDVAVDLNDNVHVSWQVEKYRGLGINLIYQDIYYQKLDNNGEKLGQTKQITSSDSLTELPQRSQALVATDSLGNAVLSWLDTRDETLWEDNNYTEFEIYFCKLDRDGEFLIGETRLTNNDYDYIFQDMCVDSQDRVHITARADDTDETYTGYLYYLMLGELGNILVETDELSDVRDRSYAPAITLLNGDCPVLFYFDYIEGNVTFYYSTLDSQGRQLVRDSPLWTVPDDGDTQDIYGASNGRELFVVCSVSETFDDEKEETRGYFMTDHQEAPVVEVARETDDGLEIPLLEPVYLVLTLVLITVGRESVKKLRKRR